MGCDKIGNRERKEVYMNVCLNSDWLPKQSFWDLQLQKKCEW